MRVLSVISSLLMILLLLPAAARAQDPSPPSDFDSSAPTPKNLPAKLNIPLYTRIEVTAWIKGAPPRNPSQPPDRNNMSLLWDPHLESAVIESDQQDVHAVFQWEGGRSSEAFLIHGLCFRLTCLAYPQIVAITSSALDFWIGSQDPTEGMGGNFPGVSWYSPSAFAGTASLNGSRVFVFAPGGKKTKGDEKPATDTYPEGPSFCLDSKTLLPVWLDDGKSLYSFTYLPAHNVQINPQGYYLRAIQRKFGHYP